MPPSSPASPSPGAYDGLLAAFEQAAALVDGRGVVAASNREWGDGPLPSHLDRDALVAAVEMLQQGTSPTVRFSSSEGSPWVARRFGEVIADAPEGLVLVVASPQRMATVRDQTHPSVSGRPVAIGSDDGEASAEGWIRRVESTTGLLGFELFEEHLDHAMRVASRRDSHVVLFTAELDELDMVAATFGPDVAAELVAAVASRLRTSLRPTDLASRDAAGRFWVLLVDIDSLDAAELVASRLVSDMARPFRVERRRLSGSVSLGVTVADPSESITRVEMSALESLRHAKNAGGNTFSITEAAGRKPVGRQIIDLARLENDDQIVVHYQPIVDTASGAVAGVEALMRWVHPHYGEVPAKEFVGLATSGGIFADLADRALVSAAEQWAALSLARQDLTPTLFVNLSPEQLRAPGEVDRIHHLLVATGLEPDQVVVEIVEEAMTLSPADSIARLVALRDLGVRIAVDDFGAGYSSLGRLRELPVDVLKVDRSLVRGIERDRRARQILSSVAALAEYLGVDCVVEGCETADEADCLGDLGFRLMQGFHFARPMAIDQLSGFLGARSVSTLSPRAPRVDGLAPGS